MHQRRIHLPTAVLGSQIEKVIKKKGMRFKGGKVYTSVHEGKFRPNELYSEIIVEDTSALFSLSHVSTLASELNGIPD